MTGPDADAPDDWKFNYFNYFTEVEEHFQRARRVIAARHEDMFRILARFGDLVSDFIVHVIFATNNAMTKKPEALRDFMRGWFETIAFMRANKADTVRIAKDVMGTDEATAGTIYDELMPMFSDTGKFDPKAVAVLSRSFVEMKTLPSEPDMSKLYTEAFLPQN